jgi:hypothetical protein
LALETIAAEDGLRERIASLNPSSVSLASWHLDGFELLTFDRLRFDAEDSTNTELEKLLATLKRGLADDNSNQAKTLEKITPLGWAVVLGVASGHLKSDLKLSFLQAERMDRKLGEVFQVVVELLKPAARGVEDGEDADDPWYGLACVLDENTFEAVIQVISRLEDFGESTGLVVSCLHTSPRFRMEPAEHDSNPLESTRRTWDVKFDDSVYELEAWRIASASTANEPQNVPAENVRIEDDRGNMRTHYSWTETRVGGRLIGVHLTKPGLADLAGFQMPSLDKIEPSEDVPEAADKNFSPAERSDENGSTPIEQSTETISSADESPQSSGTGYSSPTSASFVSKSKASGWSALTDYQTRSWNDRGDREGSHYKRIAFIQWQVEEYGS